LVSDDAARSAAREILAQPEFTRWEEDFETWLRALEGVADLIPSGLIDALSWLYEILIEKMLAPILASLIEIMEIFGVFGDAAGVVGWTAVGLLLAVLVVLVYRVWGAGYFASTSDIATRRPGHSHSDAIAVAKSLARTGQFLEAAHRIQLATLAMLIDFGWLELARSDPNRTLRERVAESGLPEQERTRLIGLVDRLESLWFDEPREDRELFEQWLALDERLLRVADGNAG